MVAHDRGLLDKAEDWYRRALELKERINDRPGVATTYHRLGMLASDRQQPNDVATNRAHHPRVDDCARRTHRQPKSVGRRHLRSGSPRSPDQSRRRQPGGTLVAARHRESDAQVPPGTRRRNALLANQGALRQHSARTRAITTSVAAFGRRRVYAPPPVIPGITMRRAVTGGCDPRATHSHTTVTFEPPGGRPRSNRVRTNQPVQLPRLGTGISLGPFLIRSRDAHAGRAAASRPRSRCRPGPV